MSAKTKISQKKKLSREVEFTRTSKYLFANKKKIKKLLIGVVKILKIFMV